MSDFNAYRFNGFKYDDHSNKYWVFNNQVNADESKILVKVADDSVFQFHTHSVWDAFGWKLNRNHIAFLKHWQVFQGAYGTFVLIDKKYYKPMDAKKPFDDVAEDGKYEWADLVKIAKAQQEAAEEIYVAKN